MKGSEKPCLFQGIRVMFVLAWAKESSLHWAFEKKWSISWKFYATLSQTSLLLLQTTTGPRTMATLLLCCICHFILTLLSGYLSKVDCSRQWWSYTSFMFENRHRVWNTMCLLLRRRLCAQRSKVHHMSGWPVMEWVSVVVLCQR